MLEKIPENDMKDLGNVREDSGECLRRFPGIFQKIPGNVQADSA